MADPEKHSGDAKSPDDGAPQELSDEMTKMMSNISETKAGYPHGIVPGVQHSPQQDTLSGLGPIPAPAGTPPMAPTLDTTEGRDSDEGSPPQMIAPKRLRASTMTIVAQEPLDDHRHYDTARIQAGIAYSVSALTFPRHLSLQA